MGKWYLYRHIRLDKNEPFYIGIGCKPNYARARQFYKRSIVWKRVRAKAKIEVEILLDGLTKEQAVSKEIEFIKLYGRLDKGTGCLVNLTDGGESTTGLVVSEQARKLNSERFKGANNPMYGKRLTPEQEARRLASFRQKNVKRSAEGILSVQKAMQHNKHACQKIKLTNTQTGEAQIFNSAAECYSYLNTSKATFGYYLAGYRVKGGIKEIEPYKTNCFKGFKIERAKAHASKARTY